MAKYHVTTMVKTNIRNPAEEELMTSELTLEEFEQWLDMWKADKTMGSSFNVRRTRV